MDTVLDTNNPSPIKKKTKSKNEKKTCKSIFKCCLELHLYSRMSIIKLTLLVSVRVQEYGV